MHVSTSIYLQRFINMTENSKNYIFRTAPSFHLRFFQMLQQAVFEKDYQQMIIVSNIQQVLALLFCSVRQAGILLMYKLCFTEERFSSKIYQAVSARFLSHSPLNGQMLLKYSEIFCRFFRRCASYLLIFVVV